MIRVVIVGAGKIAQGMDFPRSKTVTTHVRAFQHHGGFEVVAFCDLDLERAKAAARLWGVPHAAKHIEDVASLKPDLVSICTPDSTHFEVLKQSYCLNPQLVFCEKPLALNSNEGLTIVKKCRERNISLAVNYSRRWSKAVQAFRSILHKNIFGKIQSVRARYYGGWLRNGSHLVDVLGCLVSPKVESGFLLQKKKIREGDYRLTGSAVLSVPFATFPFHFECLPENPIAHIEIEFLFEKGSLWMGERNGTAWRISMARQNSKTPEFYELSEGELKKEKSSEMMKKAVRNIHRFHTNGSPLLSNGDSALKTLKMCEVLASFPILKGKTLWKNS